MMAVKRPAATPVIVKAAIHWAMAKINQLLDVADEFAAG
jgi:hypothetical protein